VVIDILPEVNTRPLHPGTTNSVHFPLTELEHQIMVLTTQGMLLKQIERKLSAERHMIAYYKRRTICKLHAYNYVHAMMLAINSDILDISEIEPCPSEVINSDVTYGGNTRR